MNIKNTYKKERITRRLNARGLVALTLSSLPEGTEIPGIIRTLNELYYESRDNPIISEVLRFNRFNFCYKLTEEILRMGGGQILSFSPDRSAIITDKIYGLAEKAKTRLTEEEIEYISGLGKKLIPYEKQASKNI